MLNKYIFMYEIPQIKIKNTHCHQTIKQVFVHDSAQNHHKSVELIVDR